MLTFPFTLFSGGFRNDFSTTFDGVDQYVDTGVDLSGLTSFTIGGWFFRAAASQRMDIAQSNNANSQRFKIINNGNGNVTIVLTPASATFVLAGTGWQHIVVVYDGTETGNSDRMQIYIDGVLQTPSFAGSIPPVVPTITNNNLEIGRDAGSSSFSEGNFDEVVYFSNAVDQTGITQLYNSGSLYTLVSWWRMGDGDAAPTIFDNKGSNDATMVNMSDSDFQEGVVPT